MAPMKTAMKKVVMKANTKKGPMKATPKVTKAMKKATPMKAMKKVTPKKVVAVSQEPSEDVKELKALIVNLKRREDRWARVSSHLSTELPWLSYERFFATDGKENPIPDDEVAPKWNTKYNALYGEYEDTFGPDGKLLHSAASFQDPGVEYLFSPGERGCAHSHYRIWQEVAKWEKPCLVLEDDVKLNFDRTSDNGVSNGKILTERLNLGMEEAKKKKVCPDGFDVLYLGWSGHREGNFRYLKAKPGRKHPVLRRVEYVWTTVAYVLWPEGARKLLKAASPMNQPVDNFMAWEAREGRLNSFVLLDKGDQEHDWSGGVVDQYNFLGDSDVVKSDGGHQGDDPTQFLAAKEQAVAPADAKPDCDVSMDSDLSASKPLEIIKHADEPVEPVDEVMTESVMA